MSIVAIDRFDDPCLDDYRSVTDAVLLRRRNRFVAEGRLVVQRLLESRHCVVSVLVNAASHRAMEAPLARLPHDVPVYVCDAADFRSVVGFNLHRGCLALAERPPRRELAEVLDGADLVVVLEGVSDADNVGSAFRNAAAFGARVLLSPTCCDPLYRKAIRTSMGSVLRLPYTWLTSWPGDLVALRDAGFTIAALTPGAHAIDLASCSCGQPRRRMALLIGSEGPGLSPPAEAMADVQVRIPITADVDSLNLATATGIALHYFSTSNPESAGGVIP